MSFPNPLRDTEPLVRSMTAAQWSVTNFELRRGELGIESDTGRMKYGVGSRWNATPYVPSEGPVQSINGATGVVSLDVVSIGGGTIGQTGVSVGWSDSSPGYGLSVVDASTGAQAVFGPLDTVMPGSVTMSGLPTSDPAVAGRLWNDGGTLKISAGA